MALNKIITIEGMKYRRSCFDDNKVRIEAITHKSHINILKEIFEMTITEPEANFTYIPDAENPLKIKFTNTSTNAVSYRWDFGDESPIVTTTSPTHTYAEVGEYEVKLTAIDVTEAEDSTSKTVTITVAI